MTSFLIGAGVGVVVAGVIALLIYLLKRKSQPTRIDIPVRPRLRPPAEAKAELESIQAAEKNRLAKLGEQRLADELNKKYSKLRQT